MELNNGNNVTRAESFIIVTMTQLKQLIPVHNNISWQMTLFRFALIIFTTTLAHGGYHVPFLFSPESHDYHHKTWVTSLYFNQIMIIKFYFLIISSLSSEQFLNLFFSSINLDPPNHQVQLLVWHAGNLGQAA